MKDIAGAIAAIIILAATTIIEQRHGTTGTLIFIGALTAVAVAYATVTYLLWRNAPIPARTQVDAR